MKKGEKKSFHGEGKVAFFARKEAIKKLVYEGYPISFIHKKYEGEMKIEYSQFARYVRRYIGRPHHDTETINSELSDRTVESPGKETLEAKRTIGKPSGDKNAGKEFNDDAEERAKNEDDLF